MKHIVLTLILIACASVSAASQSILKDGKIPKDLAITLSLGGTIQFSTQYDLRITADGKVYLENYREGLPVGRSFSELLKTTTFVMPKAPKLKEKFSKKQLKAIVSEFETSGFFAMNPYYQGDSEAETNVCINHAEEKGISITANGQTKKVAFFLGCSYGENSPLKKFLALYNFVEIQMRGVRKINSKENSTLQN